VTHVSLFSGIGGIDLAAEWAGFETIAQVERDPYCLAVLAKHWPGVHRCDDIAKFPDRDFGAIDLVSGGFPCQPFSVAGKRRGTADDRHLWPEMLRVIRAVHPSWVLAENVRGLLAIESGMVFESVLAGLETAGYTTWQGVIPACGVGAQHRRERIFVVGHAEIGGLQGFVGESLNSERKGETYPSLGNRCKHFTFESGEDVAHADTEGLERQESAGIDRGEPGRSPECDWWAVEPDMGRVAHGVPRRVDRLRALGNAVVPQQCYPILKAIAETDRGRIGG